jgi:hypothetical protein
LRVYLINITFYLSGNLEVDLNAMPSPAKKASQCNLDMLPGMGKGSHKTVSLFDSRRVRGFWPCFNDERGTAELTVCFIVYFREC